VRLLVVDDEVRFARALREGLQADGFAVDLAHTGPDGLELARGGAYDGMILDVLLPGMSGYRVVSALRAERNWVPVLMLSAKDGEYLVKPFSYVVLVARLRALLRRGVRERPVVLAAGDLRLDPASHRVRRGDADVALTAREFALLEYLMRHAGRVLSRTELLDHVWDAAEDTDPNAVEVYISYLRRKVDSPFGRHALGTVRGVGYRLAPDGG
jgi:two-component system OmpR family response regulator